MQATAKQLATLPPSWIGIRKRSGSFSKPSRKVMYALQSDQGHFLAQIDTAEQKFWVSDPNKAHLWLHPDAAHAKESSFRSLNFPGNPKAVEITFVLNDAGHYDWVIGDRVKRHGY